MVNKIINDICVWNYVRGNTEYKKDLEDFMLREEMYEYIDADTPVDEADALADIIFVAIGSLYKLTGSEEKVKAILFAVIMANNKKGVTKVDGKITKPADFEGPEKMIEKILKGVV